MVQHVKAFIAGFVATLAFHQGLLGLFYAVGMFPRQPFDLTPMPPLQVPAVVSLAFWGGVWGVLVWQLLKRASGKAYWMRAIVIGALGPSIVAWFVVMPMKGMGVAGGFDPKIIVGALLLNGAWGLGVGLIMKLLHPEADELPRAA